MKPIASGLLIILCFSPTLADDGPALKGDLAKMQGKWKGMVGRDMSIPLLLEMKGSNATMTVSNPQGRDIVIKGEVKIDDEAKPKTWDWKKFTGPDGQDFPDNLALYEIDGDTLKICSGGPGNDRPTELKAGENGPPNLISLTRLKDADKGK